ncbi:hypothetical protein FRC07_014348 [Ceratobasidium sp. 392]|nr:hypothetical protein FRC07_014348 [Ceratobasidium sp. 392]
MAYSKAEKTVGGYSLSELSPDREIADLTFRPDFFTKLVNLLTLAQCRSDKDFDDTRRSPDLVVTADAHACPPVSVNLGKAASKSTDTFRSSSESDAPSPGLVPNPEMRDPFERIEPVRVARSPKGRNKRERKGAHKDRTNKPQLAEPTTTLTPIPEIASVFERNSCLNQLNFTSTEQLVTEDALMDTDSSRARAAIALARAQLEHSRPASIHRKRERAANKLMMLPGEFEEYQATQTTPTSATAPSLAPILVPASTGPIATPDFGEIFNPGADTMRRTMEQSSSMVLTLMAAREAVSLRAEVKKNTHTQAASISTIDLLKETPVLPEPVPSRRPSQPFQVAIRNPSDGAPLTPAPTPPISSSILPSKSAVVQCTGPVETVAGACRGAQSGTPKAPKSAAPSGQTQTHFQSPASPQRPVRPQSLVGPDPPRWLVEAEAKQSNRGSNKLLNRPPGITSLQGSSAAVPTPQGSPQKPVYASYRYI